MNITYLSTQNRNVISIEVRSNLSTKQKKRNRWEDINNWLTLKAQLYEQITGKPYSWVSENYLCYPEESVIEEIREFANISVIRTWSRFIHFFIPKTPEGDKIVEFLLNQKLRPVKQLKRASMYDRGISRYFRQLDKEFLIKIKGNDK